MEFFNPALKENISFVRPAYFVITGFLGIPDIKYYLVFLFFIYIVSVVGNISVMTVLVLDHTLRSPKHIAVFNLAFTDLLSSCALVPKVIDIFLFNHHYISYNDCLTFMFFCFTLHSMQSLNLVALSVDRLMAIMYPLHYQVKVTHQLMLSLVSFFWLFVVTLILIAVGLLTRLSFCDSVVINSYFCDHGPVFRLACNDFSPSQATGNLSPVLILWLPFLFILASYCCIIHALLKISTVSGRLKAFKTCTGHLSLLAVYYIPIILVFSFGFTMHPHARVISLSLTSVLTPILNPIVYVLQTQEIKDSLKRLLKLNNTPKSVMTIMTKNNRKKVDENEN